MNTVLNNQCATFCVLSLTDLKMTLTHDFQILDGYSDPLTSLNIITQDYY